jgi:YegS/Rv2252/BmrU family lipid kinase
VPKGGGIRVVLFANVASGRGRRWLFRVVKEAEAAGISIAATHFDLNRRAVEEALAQAAREGISTVLALGGDGTVGSVADCLVGGDWTLGVLPAGTSNDFARSILLPLDPAGALRTVAAGHTARLDVAYANERAFLHAAAVGLNTEFSREAGRLRRFLGRASYPIAAINVFRHRRAFRARVEVDGEDRVHEALQVTALNSPVFGGPLELEAAAVGLQDGKVSTAIVERLHLWNLVRTLPRALRRRSLRLPGIEIVSTSRLRLITEPPLQVTVDGELGGWTPVTIEVKQQALRVIVPAEFASKHHEPSQ